MKYSALLISMVRAPVGDRYVIEEMRKNGHNLGGEQSGHIINLDHSTTGDGCLAALGVLQVMQETGKPLSQLNDLMQDVPQILVNSRVKTRIPLEEVEGYTELVTKIEKELGDRGRVFVRFSGTEPVVRVLLEGLDRKRIAAYAEEIASHLQGQLGK